MTDNITIQLDPLDTLFFKDGKPFSMGEETWADGIFPPPPSVLYGAIRTTLISEQIGEKELDNLIKKTENLTIYNIAISIRGQDEYYPLPFDVVSYKDKGLEKEDYEVFPLPIKRINLSSGSSLSVFPIYERDDNQTVEHPSKGLISRTNLIKYLKGNLATFKSKNWSDFVIEEPKVGIKRNRSTRTTSEVDGELYRVGMRRVKNDARFQITFNWQGNTNIFYENDKPVRLGAEGKLAEASIAENVIPLNAVVITRYIRVYLATDGIFQNGIPDLSRLGISAKLKGMAIGKPYMLGGFDIAEKRPKPMLKVAPAGSVFYYESDEPVDVSQLQGRSLSDNINNADYVKQGFGIAFFGTWQPQNR